MVVIDSMGEKIAQTGGNDLVCKQASSSGAGVVRHSQVFGKRKLRFAGMPGDFEKFIPIHNAFTFWKGRLEMLCRKGSEDQVC